ncbi:Chitin binding domain [Trinorchestia longiramus]|nr:Chitin binding domain [Trinorchestia longiramus]
MFGQIVYCTQHHRTPDDNMRVCLNILVLVVLVVSSRVWRTCLCLHALRARAVRRCSRAEGGQMRCFNCTTTGRCDGDVVLEGRPCPSGKACLEFSDTALCTSVEDTQCDCGGADIGCDAYDPSRQILCPVMGAVYPGSQCWPSEKCIAGQCLPVAISDDPCGPNDTLSLVYPSCTSANLCAEGTLVSTYTCQEGDYYNLEERGCRAYPPNPCGHNDGIFPLTTDCSKGVVCYDGNLLAELDCDEGKYFNTNTISCEVLSGSYPPCAAYDLCDFSFINYANSSMNSSMNSSIEITPGDQNITDWITTSTEYHTSRPISTITPITTPLTSPWPITNTTPTTTTDTTEPAPCDEENDGNGIFSFLISISTHVFTSLKWPRWLPASGPRWLPTRWTRCTPGSLGVTPRRLTYETIHSMSATALLQSLTSSFKLRGRGPGDGDQGTGTRGRGLEDGDQKTGTRRRGPEDGDQKTGTRRRGPEDGDQKTGTRRRGPGDEDQGMGTRRRGPGDGDQETGTRRRGPGILGLNERDARNLFI